MKKWILHILLFASLFGMLTTSCSQDEEVMQVGSTSGTVRIQFSLDLDGTRAAADETWGTTIDTNGNRVIGNVYENKIDLGRLQVFLFDASGRYMGEVGGLTINPSNSSNTYTFTGEVTVKGVDVTIENSVKKLRNYTIMVTANYEGYINGNIAVTQNYIFDYIAANYRPNADGEADSYIPMWGMLKTDILLHEDRATASTAATSNPVNIYMLRSLAKIEVTLKDDLYESGYRITGATLNKTKSQAYVLPSEPSNGYFDNEDYDSTSDFLTSGCNPVNNATIQSDNELFDVNATSTTLNQKTWVIYVPEMERVTTEGEHPIKIDLELGKLNGSTITDVIIDNPFVELKDYAAEGTPYYDIHRNWYYKYTIKTISDGIETTLTVNPKQWNLVEETWDYSEQAVVETGGHIKWYDADNRQITGDKLSEYMTITNALICKFQLAQPQGATWTASFVSVEGDLIPYQFETTVTDENNNQQTTYSNSLSGKIENGKQAVLKIVPKSDTIDKNNIAILRIIVTLPNGRTIHVKNLVGGENTFEEYKIVQFK